MEAVLEQYTTEEQHSVVSFCGQKGSVQRIFIKKCLQWEVFVMKSVSQLEQEILSRMSKVTDDAQPGCPVELAREATVQWVEELVQGDKLIMTV
jgi:hypothetical protein